MKIFNTISGLVILCSTVILMNVWYDIKFTVQGIILVGSVIVWAFTFCIIYPIFAKIRKGCRSSIERQALERFVSIYNAVGIFILVFFLVFPEASARSTNWLALPGLSLYYFLNFKRCVVSTPADSSSDLSR